MDALPDCGRCSELSTTRWQPTAPLVAWAEGDGAQRGGRPPAAKRSTRRRPRTRSCPVLAEGGINAGAAEAAHSGEEEEPAAVGAGTRKKTATNGKTGARRR